MKTPFLLVKDRFTVCCFRWRWPDKRSFLGVARFWYLACIRCIRKIYPTEIQPKAMKYAGLPAYFMASRWIIFKCTLEGHRMRAGIGISR